MPAKAIPFVSYILYYTILYTSHDVSRSHEGIPEARVRKARLAYCGAFICMLGIWTAVLLGGLPTYNPTPGYIPTSTISPTPTIPPAPGGSRSPWPW